MSRVAHAKLLTLLVWVPLGIAFGVGWQAVADSVRHTRFTGMVILVGSATLIAVAIAVRHAVFSVVQHFDPLDVTLYRALYFRALARLSPKRLILRIPELMDCLPDDRRVALIELLARVGPKGDIRPAWERCIRTAQVHADRYITFLPEDHDYGEDHLRKVLWRAGFVVEETDEGLVFAIKSDADRSETVELKTLVPEPEIADAEFAMLENDALNGKVSALKLMALS